MTYNQLKKTLSDLLESHAMIRMVKDSPPAEWLFKDNQPGFPVCCFTINTGSFNKGRTQVYNAQFFFLDKAGAEAEFENEIISDQIGIAYDIVELMRNEKNPYSIPDSINFNTIKDKYEEYLAGVEITIEIETQSDYDGCDAPTV